MSEFEIMVARKATKVAYEDKKNIIDLMQICPSNWETIDYDKLNLYQRKAWRLLLFAGMIQVESTILYNIELYNLNVEFVIRYTGIRGSSIANKKVSERLGLECKNKIKEAHESKSPIPDFNPILKKTRWMATADEGANFFMMINKFKKDEILDSLLHVRKTGSFVNAIKYPPRRVFLYYLGYILFPYEHDECISDGLIVSITDLNENSKQSLNIKPREYDNIINTMKDYHNEEMDAHKHTHSKVEPVPIIVHENQTEEGRAFLQSRGVLTGIKATPEEVAVYKAYFNNGINARSQSEVSKITKLSVSQVRRRAESLNRKANKNLIVWNKTPERGKDYETDQELYRNYNQKEHVRRNTQQELE